MPRSRVGNCNLGIEQVLAVPLQLLELRRSSIIIHETTVDKRCERLDPTNERYQLRKEILVFVM